MRTIYNYLLLFLICSQLATAQNVVYVYGDVSDVGTVPSGTENPFHQMRLSDTNRYGMSDFKIALEETGVTVNEVYDAETKFNRRFLKKIDVLILASNQKKFSKKEVKSIQKWVKKGGGLIAWSDSAFGGFYRHVGLDNSLGRDSNNLITEAFGMHFLTDNGAGNYLITEYTEDHFINNYKKNNGIRFRGEGVSFVRVSLPAKILAAAQDKGLGGRLVVNEIDGKFNSNTDATLAVATVKEGRVLGLFDRNMFWNAGDGTQIHHSDNRELAQRIVLWAAGIEKNDRIPEKTITKAKLNNPPVVKISHKMSDDEKTVSFVADIVDEDGDGVIPEIIWHLKAGVSSEVVFENNNPNTRTPVVTLPKIGSYKFMAVIKDGEFRIKKYVSLKRTK